MQEQILKKYSVEYETLDGEKTHATHGSLNALEYLDSLILVTKYPYAKEKLTNIKNNLILARIIYITENSLSKYEEGMLKTSKAAQRETAIENITNCIKSIKILTKANQLLKYPFLIQNQKSNQT